MGSKQNPYFLADFKNVNMTPEKVHPSKAMLEKRTFRIIFD